MSEQQYYIKVRKELQRINEIIDAKIVQGKGYTFEARKHMMLREMIRKAKQQNKKQKSFGLFSFLTSSRV